MNKQLIAILCTMFFNVYASENKIELHKRIGICSTQNKRSHNEDCYDCTVVDDGQLYMVFDGHRGDFAAQYLQRNFATYFKDAAGDSVRQKMVAACKNLDDNLITYLKTKERVTDDSRYGYCGSTAVVAFIKKDLAYFVYVGDSSLLLEENGTVAVATIGHKLSNHHEHQRLKEAKADHYIKQDQGCLRLKGLAMSRVFGDYALKNYLTNKHGSSVIIADPDCITQKLTDQHRFLVLASDGLWDVMSNEDVAQIVHEKKDDNIDTITEFLVNSAVTKGSKDNITVMLVDLLS